jgi:hypothetical protein
VPDVQINLKQLSFMPVLRSLLIGLLTVAGLLGLFLAAQPGMYNYDVTQPGRSVYSHGFVVALSRLGWVWVALSIVGSYVWHTRRLNRTTRAGVVAEVLMLVQYVFWLVLQLAFQLYLGILMQGLPK